MNGFDFCFQMEKLEQIKETIEQAKYYELWVLSGK